MGLFSYFFSSKPKDLEVVHSTPRPVKYNAAGVPVFENNKVLAINDGKEDDFIQVDFRKLSYAEVAALKANKSESLSKKASKGIDIVDINQDLGTDITDYQLAETIQKQMDARDLQEAVAAQKVYLLQGNGQNDELNDFADKFDTKVANIKQQKKHKKNKKDKIKIAQHAYLN